MILIIDDDIAVRASLLYLLQNEGYKVTTAASRKKLYIFWGSMKFHWYCST